MLSGSMKWPLQKKIQWPTKPVSDRFRCAEKLRHHLLYRFFTFVVFVFHVNPMTFTKTSQK